MERLHAILGHLSAAQTPTLKQVQAIENVRAQLTVSLPKLRHMQACMLEEAVLGLRDEANSPMKMLVSFVEKKNLPKSKTPKYYYGLDLGGTNFRVLKLTFKDGKIVESKVSKFKIPEDIMAGPQASATRLFDFIADSVLSVSGKEDKSELGFTFSFPVKQHALNIGVLLKWTKGFMTPGVEGQDVVKMLQQAFDRKSLSLRIVALCNDTVGTLATQYAKDPSCAVGVILGTGTNGCYWEQTKNIPKLPQGAGNPIKGEYVAINMEWGGFDSGNPGPRALPLSMFDVQVDAESLSPGIQRFEKMVSGFYLAEISRLVFVYLQSSGALPAWTSNPNSFVGYDTRDILSDKSAKLEAIDKLIQKKWGGSTTLEHRALIKEVVQLVTTRSAQLASMAIATIVAKIGQVKKCTVAVDGALFLDVPGYRQTMESTLVQLLGKDHGVKLVKTEDGSGQGAAFIAMLATH